MRNIFSKKKKVLIFHHSGVYGGASASLIHLLSYLNKFYDCTVVTPKGTVTEVFSKININYIITAGLPQLNNNYWGNYSGLRLAILVREFFYLIRFFFFIKKINVIQPDIIHLNDYNLLLIAKIIKFYFPKIIIFCHVRALQNKKNSLLKKIQEKFLVNSIHKFVCIDNDVYKSLGSSVKKKSVIIYNSFVDAKKKLPYKKSLFYIGVVGNFTDSKGIEIIFEAAKMLRKEKFIKFIIVGPIPDKTAIFDKFLNLTGLRVNYFQSIMEQSKNLDNIDFVGFRENLDIFYKNISLIAFPSYLNAAGRPVLEAAMMGIPSIIALDDNIKNDLVYNNINGLYCKKKNTRDFVKKILKISLDKKLYQKLSIACSRISAKKFNININGKKFAQLINESLK
jgi:glycosyltransferase involved in cell wall biosynthesis